MEAEHKLKKAALLTQIPSMWFVELCRAANSKLYRLSTNGPIWHQATNARLTSAHLYKICTRSAAQNTCIPPTHISWPAPGVLPCGGVGGVAFHKRLRHNTQVPIRQDIIMLLGTYQIVVQNLSKYQ
ncbi:hypothetical protein BDZ45DRAFT_743667 [Acephala macrosclerotiorum]|nr:hypothetical protein BDZ45DRAFT_743667 [Acephala macrosclerotiorum]